MKTLFYIVFLISSNILFSQIFPTYFINHERNNSNQQNLILSDWDERICEIELQADNKFTFKSKPSYISCLSWREYNGDWKKSNDTITFLDKHKIYERNEKLIFSNSPENKFYLLKFQTDTNLKLTKRKIKIWLIYDFDSKLKDVELKMKLKKDFTLKIPFNKIKHISEIASIKYEYILPNGEKRTGYTIPDNTSINKKPRKANNHIIITLVENPRIDTIYRTTKGIISKKEIRIISTNKTKSDISDYYSNLAFKEYYKAE